ncbi:glutaredoxin family protein [Microbacterium sp. STN6]|uniref:glutaredoxin family protein n=1 Tax=Microbacterium sp. STN6 TaxID=2995588 RepID=UPI002260DC51|nr:glutaredoxin family protein [Microbacterium sp. STN6]MCX7520672.1 glutaredoxin family protein [Microbacterium sp. STN6]
MSSTPDARPVTLTLLGKPGCHLCDDARAVIAGVMEELATDAAAPALRFEELSILDDPALLEKYVDDIPVLLIDGRVHTYWRVDPARLRRALTVQR